MDYYSGKYNYQPLRIGTRALFKKDGTFPPPDIPEGTLCLTASTKNYCMETTGDLRILEVLPGSFDDSLHCRLRVAAIERNPVYDALSYMWGDPTFSGKIILDGEDFSVTGSLETALRHLRRPAGVRFLWADAVCINQRDKKERGNQVHLMKEIYSRSQIVRVWIDVDLSLDDPGVRKLFTLQLQGDQLGDDPGVLKRLIPLLQNPYWDRLWIQQELVFAPRLVFHCRQVIIPGICLMALQLQIYRKSTLPRMPFDADDEWHQFGRLVSSTKSPSRNLACWRKMMETRTPVDPKTLQPDLSLLKPDADWQLDPQRYGASLSNSPIYLYGMLRHTQSLKATEPRDRVIASLNLVIDYDDDGTEYDYEQSLAEWYLRVARLLPFKCNSLQFLVMTKTPTIPDPTVQGLPSWAPNWNSPRNAEYFSRPFRAAGDLPMYGTPFHSENSLDPRKDMLHVRGFRYAGVDRTLSATDNAFSPLSILSKLFISTVESTECSNSDISELASTLTGPAIAELCMERDHFSNKEAVLYTSILLTYSFVTPGLRISDLLPYATSLYNYSQRSVTVTIRALRTFRYLYPSRLRWLDLDMMSAAVPKEHDQAERFGQFVRLVNRTLSSGGLTSISRGCKLAIMEGKASVQSGDEIWILFGCPTPVVLRPIAIRQMDSPRTASHFLVVSPAYIPGIMNGELMDAVTTPDKKDGGWSRVLKEGCLSSANASLYMSGRDKWLVEVIRLR
jgi:hypothetical protein